MKIPPLLASRIGTAMLSGTTVRKAHAALDEHDALKTLQMLPGALSISSQTWFSLRKAA